MGDFLSYIHIPEGYLGEHFVFTPLLPWHAEIDYEAVMSSKEFLRKWSQSLWPQDNFTLSENLQDLEMHAHEHFEKIAYTYTILNSNKDHCWGCIYINPNTRITPVSAEESLLLISRPANVRFWVRESFQHTKMEQTILESIVTWIQHEWKLGSILYTCNQHVPQQIGLFQACGLELWLKLEQPSRQDLIWCQA